MKKYLSVLMISMSAILLSCKKENLPKGESISLIKSTTRNSEVVNYTYDNEGRCVQVDYNNGFVQKFEYQPGLVISKEFTNGVLTNEYHNELNSDGNVIFRNSVNNPDYQVSYNYDNNQYVKFGNSKNTQIEYDYYYYWSNGNIDSVSRFKKNGEWLYSTHYTYYTDKMNSISSIAMGQKFYGKQSKNLIKTQVTLNENGIIESHQISYEFDAKGRVIKMIDVLNGLPSWTKIFSYQ